MKRTAQNRFKALTSACVMVMMATVAWSQTLTWLGTLPGYDSSVATAVSADGTVVVGMALNAAGQSRAFRWTRTGGMEDLGTLGGSESAAFDVSWDGSVVVGGACNAAGVNCAFRWTRAGGMQNISHGITGEAAAVSADGTVVVGHVSIVEHVLVKTHPFFWTESRGTLRSPFFGRAFGISADGSIVAGVFWNLLEDSRKFYISRVGDIPKVIDGATQVEFASLSANGRVIVGFAKTTGGQDIAVRWREGAGVQPLGTLGGAWSRARSVSADGSIVVGESEDAAEKPCAFRWTLSGGMENLNRTYASLLRDGSFLGIAADISPDGRYIVGCGYNAATKRAEAFLLDTRAPQRVQPQQQQKTQQTQQKKAQQKKPQQKKPRTRR